jgi:putative restriction endonuclease
MPNPLQFYIQKFKKLRVDRSHGVAPHKPILLLAVLQTYQMGSGGGDKVFLTPELVGLFKTNWSLLVRTQHDCRISYPFYHMKSEGFWKLMPNPGYQNIERFEAIMKNINGLQAAVEFAMLDADLAQLMTDKESNLVLVHTLLNHYFPETKVNFSRSEARQLQLFNSIEDKILNDSTVTYRQEMETLIAEKDEEEIFLRGSLFKREIPRLYNNTCCISGLRIHAVSQVSMVDACHIVPFSVSYDDTVTNGIALSPTLHRAFDRGLIGIDQNYCVTVSEVFKEESSTHGIRAFHGKEIFLPVSSKYFPAEENFAWHREHVFKMDGNNYL